MNTCVVQCPLTNLSIVDESSQPTLISQPTPPNSPQPTNACTKNDSLNVLPPTPTDNPLLVVQKQNTHRNHLQTTLRSLDCPSTSLADLIPVATAALKATKNAYDQNIDTDDSSAYTSFASIVAKVKVQVMTRRLKEKYLGLEWIRLALQLPVDESTINNQSIRDKVVWTLLNKRLDNRTGEIATWYEWKFNKAKFTIEQVQDKVDRLRQRKVDYQNQRSMQAQESSLFTSTLV
ncbi:hypothetical protein CLU79DRAFT_421378 [Phycomyces nitens]|nr:hypothetical protein CLU79DRAFT_421378 [Phycomyces nitens]